MKKSESSKLDDIWRKLIKDIAGWKCEHCGRSGRMEAHHVFGRRCHATRWDLRNGVCLCNSCHIFGNRFSAHETPTLFKDWFVEKRGQELYDYLLLKHNLNFHGDYLEVYNSLYGVSIEDMKKINKVGI